MRTAVLALVLPSVLALALGACASTPSPAAAPRESFAPEDRTAIQTVLARQIEAWNRGDLASYMEGYARSPGLIFTSGGNVRRGWEEAFKHYKARYAVDPAAMGKLAFEVESIDPVGAGGAVVLGRWELTEAEHPGRGVFSLVLERRPEGWRIIHDHTSVSP
jgi:ketosteroid isomerase-like protein